VAKPKTTHTVESLLARCEEEGECFLWKGYSTNNTPMVHQDGKMVSVRRLLIDMEGREFKGKYTGSSCGNPMCINPAHIVQRTVKAHITRMAKKSAEPEAKLRRINAMLVWRRQNPLKLDMDRARLIRDDERTPVEIALDFGISKSMVCRIKRGEQWRDLSNPFSALLLASI
jgi:hypothetical protein